MSFQSSPDQLHEARQRASRVIAAVDKNDIPAIQKELTHNVLFEGIASVEATFGMGWDFRAGDIYVRVYGSAVPLPRDCVANHVAAFGKLVNVYCENRVISISVQTQNYELTGTT